MTTEQVSTVLKREKRSPKFPAYKPAPFRDPFEEDAFFDDEEAAEDNDEPTFEDIARLLVEKAEAEAQRKRRKKGRRDLPEQGELF